MSAAWTKRYVTFCLLSPFDAQHRASDLSAFTIPAGYTTTDNLPREGASPHGFEEVSGQSKCRRASSKDHHAACEFADLVGRERPQARSAPMSLKKSPLLRA
jgi:hypothetical protein